MTLAEPFQLADGGLCLRTGVESSSSELHDRPFGDEAIDPLLLEAWQSPEIAWLSPSEPPARAARVPQRMVGYDPIARTLRFVSYQGAQGLAALEAPEVELERPYAGGQLLFSARTQRVIGVGGVLDGEPSTHVRILDLGTLRRLDVELSEPLGETVAAAVDGSGRYLVALARGEEAMEPLSLWRIDLRSGECALLAQGSGNERETYGLSALPDGTWALMAGGTQGATVDVFRVSDGAIQELRHASLSQAPAAGRMVGHTQGVSLVVTDDTYGLRPLGVSNAQMVNDEVPIDALF